MAQSGAAAVSRVVRRFSLDFSPCWLEARPMSDNQNPSLDERKDIGMEMPSDGSEADLTEKLRNPIWVCRTLGIPLDDISVSIEFLISIGTERIRQEIERISGGKGPSAHLTGEYWEFATKRKNEQKGKSLTERVAGTPALLGLAKKDRAESGRKMTMKLARELADESHQEWNPEFVSGLVDELVRESDRRAGKHFVNELRIELDMAFNFNYSIYPDPEFFSNPNLPPLDLLIGNLPPSQPGVK